MKKGIILLTLIVFTAFGCKKLKELTTFDIKNTAQFTIPKTALINTPVLDTTPVHSSSKFAFESHNTNANNVEEIKLKSLRLSIVDPPGQNFNFLKSIEIFISAPGLNEVRLAYLETIPQNVNAIDLITTGEKLDEYIKGESYSLRISAVTTLSLTENVQVQSDMVFSVRAKLL
jgi:hypothetical protein